MQQIESVHCSCPRIRVLFIALKYMEVCIMCRVHLCNQVLRFFQRLLRPQLQMCFSSCIFCFVKWRVSDSCNQFELFLLISGFIFASTLLSGQQLLQHWVDSDCFLFNRQECRACGRLVVNQICVSFFLFWKDTFLIFYFGKAASLTFACKNYFRVLSYQGSFCFKLLWINLRD